MSKLIDYEKSIKESDIIEIKVWEVLPTKDFPHGLKYSFVYIHNGKRIFGYDNERAKGDHVHIFDKEETYHFISLEKLRQDFEFGIKEMRLVLYGNKED